MGISALIGTTIFIVSAILLPAGFVALLLSAITSHKKGVKWSLITMAMGAGLLLLSFTLCTAGFNNERQHYDVSPEADTISASE